MKKSIGVVIVVIVCIAVIVGLIILLKDNDETYEPVTIVKNNNSEAPSRVYSNEKDVKENKALEVFKFIPKVYTEEIAPFSSEFMLNAVMSKIIQTEEEPDFSEENVNKKVKELFGDNAKIDKTKVSTPDIAKSLYYYSEEADSYSVIPVGIEGIFEYQILKNVTETDEAYFVYVYTLIGGYSYDENSVYVDEFGDIDYENSKVQLIVGDKNGNDLVHVFDNYDKMFDESIWLKEYSNMMPVFRYTLKKENEKYYLTEVEQINY